MPSSCREIEERRTRLAQFERVDIDLSGMEEWRDLIGAMQRRAKPQCPCIWSPELGRPIDEEVLRSGDAPMTICSAAVPDHSSF